MKLTFTSPSLIPVVAAFLKEQSQETEDAVLAALNRSLVYNDFAPVKDGFIEWGCVEHNLIHVFADEGQNIIEILPSGEVTALP